MELNLSQLALRLTALRLEMERRQPASAATVNFSLPGLVLKSNPAAVSPFPSRNQNEVQILETGARVNPPALIDYYQSRGVTLFNVWIDPLPTAAALVGDLLAAGFQRFEGTTYPVLVRLPAPAPLPPCDFALRHLDPATDAEAVSCYGDETAQGNFRETLGREGFDHFAAFHEGRPVATGRMFTHQGLSYLNDGGTLENFRNRGAQSALISTRVNRAMELRSELCIVQTLAFLGTSLGNLRRGGFQPVYERIVYSWNAAEPVN